MNKTWKLSLGIGVISVILLIFNSLTPSSAPLAYAQSCTLPVQVTNAVITFPYCVNGNCNFAQGSCSWNALTGATGYNAIITAVGTNTQVLNQQAYTSTTLAFPVATSDTYRCDVSAVNSCGAGPVATSSLLCNTEFVATPTPTSTSTTTSLPTQVVTTGVPTSIPPVTLPPTGSNISVLLGFAGFVIVAIGFSMLLL